MNADGTGVTPAHPHARRRRLSRVVARRPHDHVRLRSRRQLRHLRDERGRHERPPADAPSVRATCPPPGLPTASAIVFMSDREGGGFDVYRAGAGSGGGRDARHADRDHVVPGLLTGRPDAGVSRRPRRAHTMAASGAARSAAADDGSRQRHVSVVVARRQADRVHELAKRQDRDLHDERGRHRSEGAGVDGPGRRGRSALVAGWIARSRSSTCRTA